ncbi:hypothetical protein [uncultured Treponema sp.]|uniref:hypothetical protein n=1 Tax=uncultured Treponema sp. TaxID=162155 RepID=UPI0025EB6580|nr:hypothetical protein [uncultured Treponema sp.]
MKSKIVLILLMVAATSCFAQKWKGLVKGIEGRVGGNNNSQTTEQTQAIEQTAQRKILQNFQTILKFRKWRLILQKLKSRSTQKTIELPQKTTITLQK